MTIQFVIGIIPRVPVHLGPYQLGDFGGFESPAFRSTNLRSFQNPILVGIPPVARELTIGVLVVLTSYTVSWSEMLAVMPVLFARPRRNRKSVSQKQKYRVALWLASYYSIL